MTRILSCLVIVALASATAATEGQAPQGQAPPAAPAAQPGPAPRAAAQPPSPRLPVRRVVLYKSGVGYFEHVGRVSGTQTVSIDLTSGQLDDVLKSLTTVDLGGGQVTGITFNTETPLGEQLRTARLALGPMATRDDVLQALRGTRVEVRRAGILAAGRVLVVQSELRGPPENARTEQHLTIVGDGGEIRTFELGPGVTVTIVEGDTRRDLAQYLDIIGSARAQQTRRLQVATRGGANREIFVSYVSAVPVWKTTYRLVIPREGARKPFLQGWAVVDNTLGEDWTDVELSLVAGAPQSFVQPLSKPIYTQRPVVPIQTGAVVAPEIHGAAMTGGPSTIRGRIADAQGGNVPGAVVRALSGGREVASTVSDENGRYQLAGVAAGTVTLRAELTGFRTAERTLTVRGGTTTLDLTLEVGSLAETVEVREGTALLSAARSGRAAGAAGGGVGGLPSAPPPPPPAPAPRAVEDAMASQMASAAGGDLGELFEYRLTQPVTIRRNQSALVPIVQQDVGVERVSLWSAARGVAQPLRAIWLTNDTGLTLDGGSLTLVEGGAFAGEGLVEAIKPGEKRFVSYAMDLAVRVTAVPQETGRRVSRIRIANSVLTQSVDERASTLYTVRNDDAAARDVVIEHPVRAGWTLTGGAKPAESTATAHRFRLAVAAKSTATLTVGETRPIDSRVGVSNVSDDQIALILRGKGATAGLEPQLRAVAAKSREVALAQRAIHDRQQELNRITQDQARVRENLEALEGTSAEKALVERYARQLSTQEDRLEVLRREIEAREAERAALQAELTRLVAALSVDVEIP